MQCRLSQSKHSTYQAPKEVDKIQEFQKGYYRSSKKNKTRIKLTVSTAFHIQLSFITCSNYQIQFNKKNLHSDEKILISSIEVLLYFFSILLYIRKLPILQPFK